jgi:hypothetical protein
MAGQRLTDKTALEEQTGSGDLYMIVDVNDTTGSSAGTSKKLDSKFVIQTDKISLSNQDVLDLINDGRTLVGALSGYMITPIVATVLCTYASSTESSRNNMLFGFDDSSSVSYAMRIQSIMDSKTTNFTYHTSPQAVTANNGSWSASTINKPLMVWADSAGGAFNGGWSCDIYITYCYTKVL